MAEDSRRLYALRLRGGRDAVHRVYGRARQVPARSGPAERGRVLVQGRRRAMAVAALRSHRAARPLCRRELRPRCRSPTARYRAGWVFRNEKPGPGRFRQFMQFDADTVGAASPAADAEICMMAADCLEALGVKRGDYVIKVNNRKVLDGVMEAIGLGGEANAGRAPHRAARDRQARSARAGRRARDLLGGGTQGRERRFHQGARSWTPGRPSECSPESRTRSLATPAVQPAYS